jgi:hypothetical protein
MNGITVGARALSCCMIISTAYAVADLESARKIILTTLEQDHPEQIAEFNHFFKKYDAVVLNFFDKKNQEPLKIHIKQMETELQALKDVCEDMRYCSINGILSHYYTSITELIILLKHYVDSHDTISLAFKVRKFKAILPEAVKQRGDIALFWGLHHRLRCG